MKRTIFLVIAIFIVIAPAMGEKKSGKGHLSVKAKVSTYTTSGGSTTLMYGLTASYAVSDRISVDGTVEWTQYTEDGENVELMPITVDGVFHPLGQRAFDPYIGAGIGAYLTKRGETQSGTFGMQVIGGVGYHPTSNFGVSFEVKYRLPDVAHPSGGGISFGGGVEGSLETTL